MSGCGAFGFIFSLWRFVISILSNAPCRFQQILILLPLLALAVGFITVSMAKIILTVRTADITVVTVTITKVTSVDSYATIVYYKIAMENDYKLVRSIFCTIEHLAIA